ncbi:regulator of microtubule dynamics protein 1 [Clonorchis sinensis]|uniref:Regulator of microtubule dynamics protein 1 n=1 Tax=Clonorchis sinensis TaxID=79923 RepID=G7YHJ5_CLOSI|nr:regulator of microtubule dynamics protein 1 [Clonorchis sinensis]
MEELYEKADALFELENYTDCYNLLVDIEECHQVADVYWRLARCLYYKSGLPCENVNYLVFTGTPQWYGIGVDELAGLDGVHERLKHSPVSHYYWTFPKHNLQKAIELDPNNFLAHSELGIWYFIVSDVSEVIRKFETVFYTSPPIATYEENVSFSQSDLMLKVCPRHLIRNMLYLAKCYKALGQYDESLAFCKLVIEYQGSGYDVEESVATVYHDPNNSYRKEEKPFNANSSISKHQLKQLQAIGQDESQCSSCLVRLKRRAFIDECTKLSKTLCEALKHAFDASNETPPVMPYNCPQILKLVTRNSCEISSVCDPDLVHERF